MVHHFRFRRWRAPIVPSQTLNIVPIREKPGFELVLRGMRKKSFAWPHPFVHLPLRIGGVNEVAVSRVDIGQRNDRLGPGTQVSLDIQSELVSFPCAPIVWVRIKARHPAG